MQNINGTTLLSTADMMLRTNKSRSTLVRWANKGCTGAYYNNYSQSWEWDWDEYIAGIKRNGKRPQPHAGPRTKRGRKGRFEVVG